MRNKNTSFGMFFRVHPGFEPKLKIKSEILPVAEAVKVVKESGLKYQIGAMGATIEGEWGQIIKIIC